MISEKEIQEIQELIIQEYAPYKIILFGSYANGTATDKSDLDLFVVSDIEKTLPRWKRGLALRLKLSKFIFPRDILFYTRDEVSHWLDTPMSFINSIYKTGKVLYEQK